MMHGAFGPGPVAARARLSRLGISRSRAHRDGRERQDGAVTQQPAGDHRAEMPPHRPHHRQLSTRRARHRCDADPRSGSFADFARASGSETAHVIPTEDAHFTPVGAGPVVMPILSAMTFAVGSTPVAAGRTSSRPSHASVPSATAM